MSRLLDDCIAVVRLCRLQPLDSEAVESFSRVLLLSRDLQKPFCEIVCFDDPIRRQWLFDWQRVQRHQILADYHTNLTLTLMRLDGYS